MGRFSSSAAVENALSKAGRHASQECDLKLRSRAVCYSSALCFCCILFYVLSHFRPFPFEIWICKCLPPLRNEACEFQFVMENLNIKLHKAINFNFINLLYGCENLSLSLREKTSIGYDDLVFLGF